MDDFDDLEQWSNEGAARLRSAASDLSRAVLAHAEATSQLSERPSFAQLQELNERLVAPALAYAEAQVLHTGNAFPFGLLRQHVEDDDADVFDDDPDGQKATATRSGVSVLQRHDYRVTDEAAVMEAGRAAYRTAWPDDPENAAVEDVQTVGRALYQVAHAHGWHHLTEIDGLQLAGRWTGVVPNEDLFGPNPDDWPADPFDIDADLIYEVSDIFHP